MRHSKDKYIMPATIGLSKTTCIRTHLGSASVRLDHVVELGRTKCIIRPSVALGHANTKLPNPDQMWSNEAKM